MSKGKGKKQFQGAGRRFRADIWMDEKVSARTMYALQERGVKFPPGTNVRGTREFKDEFKRQLSKFKQEHAAKIAAKKKRRRKLPSSLRRKKLHNKLDAICLGTDLHIDWLHPLKPTAEIPGSELGTRNRGISKQIYRAFARLEMMNRIDN